MKRHCRAARNGFSLTEAVVIIGIVSVLVAILSPILAQSNTQTDLCQSNLKRLGIAFRQYAKDYDGRLPGGGAFYPVNLGGTSVYYTWDLGLLPYTKSHQLVTCPSDSVTPIVNLPTIGRVRRSYTYANYLRSMPGGGTVAPAARAPGRSMATIPEPALTVLLGERFGSTGNGAFFITVANYNRFATTANTKEWASEAGKNFFDSALNFTKNVPDGTGGRHLGSNNILYVDGHVKAIRMSLEGNVVLAGHPAGGARGTWINIDLDLPREAGRDRQPVYVVNPGVYGRMA